MPTAVFVYGTLKRGQCRESLWPLRPLKICEACVLGSLFARDDYPAMTAGQDRVLGELWQFGAAELPMVLKSLDQIEGTNQADVDDLYHRVIVEAFDTSDHLLGTAYTYRYAGDPLADGFELIQPPSKDAYVAWPAGAAARPSVALPR